MKELQVSLYDIFGYLVPGAFTLFAVVIAYWTIFGHSTPDLNLMTVPSWTLGAALAYLFGHLTQAIANLVFGHKRFKSNANLLLSRGSLGALNAAIIEAAENKAKSMAGLPATTALSPGELYDLCDHMVLERGQTHARDIYVYREGFYRGICIASVFVASAFLIRTLFEHNTIRNGSTLYDFGRSSCAILALICAACAYLSFLRFRRFGQYLAKMAIYGTLAINQEASKSS